jgi:colanic acid biosynthesis glycosyl transferase WcaI
MCRVSVLSEMAKQNTLLIISQVYPPDPAAVGQQIADVAAAMVRRGWRVIVYTASRGYDDPSVRYPYRELLRGVHVRRLPLSSFGKNSIAVRLLAQLSFVAQAVMASLFINGLSRILVSTSPPFAGFGGTVISWVRRVPMVWWVMDINPDQLVATGRVGAKSFVVRCFDWMNRCTLRRASHVVVLDRFMRDRMLKKMDVSQKVHVTPPWAHDHVAGNVLHADNPFRSRYGLQDSFVVMYAGNHGEATPVEAMLEAARLLQADARIKFVFIGGGVRKALVDRFVERERPGSVLSLPYQPLKDIRFSLAAADVHLVSLAPEGVGVVHPCKLYGALACGRPVIAISPTESYATDILQHRSVGWICRGMRAEDIVATVATAAACSGEELQRLSANAKQLAATDFKSELLCDSVCNLLE